jgi:hypothetical protein
MTMPHSLSCLVGHEHGIETIGTAMKSYALASGVGVIGAYQVRCSDETEKENAAIFHQVVVRALLPELKYWSRSAFRTTNLGGRYERGAIAIDESHFAIEESKSSFNLLLVTLSAHVSVRRDQHGLSYGLMSRYDHDSTCCGALAAMIGGSDLPFALELREAFSDGDLDRVSILCDEARIPPR